MPEDRVEGATSFSVPTDGGPAFPVPILHDPAEAGQSLRDYFAGQALVAVVAGFTHDTDPTASGERAQLVARWAYAYADAMLAAR